VNDTIVAISSPPGEGLRGIIRTSGPAAFACVAAVFRPTPLPVSRWAAYFGEVDGPEGTAASAHLLLMPAPRSYTREDVAEIHTFGALPLLAHIVARLIAAGARPAEPGEFTLRAFLEGRIDLLQAEAVVALIEAHDEAAFRHAQRALAGDVGAAVARARETLLALRADIEAELNFPEEEAVRFRRREEVCATIRAVRDSLYALRAGAAPRQGALRIVLLGRANAGKSTLFNALIAREHALVHHLPGTTLDAVTADLTIAGVLCTLIDTAGTGHFEGMLASAAHEARENELAGADLAVGVVDLHVRDAHAALAELGARDVLVGAKSELVDAAALAAWEARLVPVSVVTGAGLERLRAALYARVEELYRPGALVSVRQNDALVRALGALALAEEALDHSELCAVELRMAQDALGELAGDGVAGDVLGEIFARFCIGK
jgi:tRNA modification GTPase